MSAGTRSARIESLSGTMSRTPPISCAALGAFPPVARGGMNVAFPHPDRHAAEDRARG